MVKFLDHFLYSRHTTCFCAYFPIFLLKPVTISRPFRASSLPLHPCFTSVFPTNRFTRTGCCLLIFNFFQRYTQWHFLFYFLLYHFISVQKNVIYWKSTAFFCLTSLEKLKRIFRVFYHDFLKKSHIPLLFLHISICSRDCTYLHVWKELLSFCVLPFIVFLYNRFLPFFVKIRFLQ